MLLANLIFGNVGNFGRLLRPPSPQLWGSMNSKSSRIDAAGEFNTWKYWRRSEGSLRPPSPQFWMLLANLTIGHIVNSEGFLRPPSPQFWGSKNLKAPKIGEFRGPSTILTMLRNNSPATSFAGGFRGINPLRDWSTRLLYTQCS